MKMLYLVRHCQAEGQPPEASLTEKGSQQSVQLADFLKDRHVDFISSSPYIRAVKTIEPLAKDLGVAIHKEARLKERVLSLRPHPDWLERLMRSFDDLSISFDGGESSETAMIRGIQVIQEFLLSPYKSGVFVTHGNLLALILKYYDPGFGFDQWKTLTNPDVFEFRFDHEQASPSIERIWRNGN